VSGAFVLAFIVAFLHAMFLGLPAALTLVHKHMFRAIPMLVAGGIVGLVPASLLMLAMYPPGEWLTMIGYVGGAFVLGASGGLAFFCAHKAISPNNSFKPSPLRGLGNRPL
jgi:hypothetical protein